MSGILGGLPITAVIVRSSANVKPVPVLNFSSILHGPWLLIAILIAIPLLNRIPYCVLAVILTRTGYQLAKPSMIKENLSTGKRAVFAFIVTVIYLDHRSVDRGVYWDRIQYLFYVQNIPTELDFNWSSLRKDITLSISSRWIKTLVFKQTPIDRYPGSNTWIFHCVYRWDIKHLYWQGYPGDHCWF